MIPIIEKDLIPPPTMEMIHTIRILHLTVIRMNTIMEITVIPTMLLPVKLRPSIQGIIIRNKKEVICPPVIGGSSF